MNAASLVLLLIAVAAGSALLVVLALRRMLERARDDGVQRLLQAEERLKQVYVRLGGLEEEVTRQGIQLEEQSIQLETQAYWED